MSDSSTSQAAVGSTFRWLLPLWWLSTRRRWKEHGGAIVGALSVATLLMFAAGSAPPDGLPLYHSILLALLLGAIVGSPLMLSVDSVVSSARLQLLPLSRPARWAGRAVLANTLRSALLVVTLGWSAWVLSTANLPFTVHVLRQLQVVALLFAAVALSLLIEDVVKLARAVVLHQLLFLIALILWPLAVEYLRSPSNFAPPPAWTLGPPAEWLLTTADSDVLPLLLTTLAVLSLGAALVAADHTFLNSYGSRPPKPASSVVWTATVARLLSGGAMRNYLLFKELLVPLRFLFLRMCLVFVALTSVAAGLAGAPWLLLSAPFWWQPLSTNALGPDTGDAEHRYALVGLSLPLVLRWRFLGSVLLTATTMIGVGMAMLAAGVLEAPRLGPPNLAVYPLAILFALSLMGLWAVAGDRYSLAFPDRLEMQTLLPDRTRSARASAVLILFVMWIGLLVGAAAILALSAVLVLVLLPGPIELVRLTFITLVATSANATVYLLHTRRWLRNAG